MGKSLAGAYPGFQENLRKAIYDAYISQFNTSGLGGELSKNASEIDQQTDIAATKFANSLSKDLAKYIYEFVSEMQILITHNIVPGTITTPMGPATGTFTVSPTEVTIS